MEHVRVLSNKNKIVTSKTSNKYKTSIHNALSFHFAFEGEQNFILNKRKLSVFPYSFLTLNAGTLYSTIVDSPNPACLLSIDFDSDFIGDFNRSLQRRDALLLDSPPSENSIDGADLVLNETIYPFIGDMKYNICHINQLILTNSQDDLLLNEHLHHCLINYHATYHKEVIQRKERLQVIQKGTRDEILRRLNLAKDYLYSNYNQNINLNELAAYCCMSINYLLRMFKQAFAITPHQFLIRIRLHQAKLFIKSSDYPVNEIVNLIGLNCTSSFIELFKERYGITPLKYRNSGVSF